MNQFFQLAVGMGIVTGVATTVLIGAYVARTVGRAVWRWGARRVNRRRGCEGIGAHEN